VDGYVEEWDGVWGWVEWDDDGGGFRQGGIGRGGGGGSAEIRYEKDGHDHESAITGNNGPNERFDLSSANWTTSKNHQCARNDFDTLQAYRVGHNAEKT